MKDLYDRIDDIVRDALDDWYRYGMACADGDTVFWSPDDCSTVTEKIMKEIEP